eukprot:29833-Pelagococcus_subviridis.AAC.5
MRAVRSAATRASAAAGVRPAPAARHRSPSAAAIGSSAPSMSIIQCVGGACNPSAASNTLCSVKSASSRTPARDSLSPTRRSSPTTSFHGPSNACARSDVTACSGGGGDAPCGDVSDANASAVSTASSPWHHAHMDAHAEESKEMAAIDRASPPCVASTNAAAASTNDLTFHGRTRLSTIAPSAVAAAGVAAEAPSAAPSSEATAAPMIRDSALNPCAAASGCRADAIRSLQIVSHPFCVLTLSAATETRTQSSRAMHGEEPAADAHELENRALDERRRRLRALHDDPQVPVHVRQERLRAVFVAQRHADEDVEAEERDVLVLGAGDDEPGAGAAAGGRRRRAARRSRVALRRVAARWAARRRQRADEVKQRLWFQKLRVVREDFVDAARVDASNRALLRGFFRLRERRLCGGAAVVVRVQAQEPEETARGGRLLRELRVRFRRRRFAAVERAHRPAVSLVHAETGSDFFREQTELLQAHDEVEQVTPPPAEGVAVPVRDRERGHRRGSRFIVLAESHGRSLRRRGGGRRRRRPAAAAAAAAVAAKIRRRRELTQRRHEVVHHVAQFVVPRDARDP